MAKSSQKSQIDSPFNEDEMSISIFEALKTIKDMKS